MAGKFGDLDQYFSPGLTLTVLGKEYVLPLASAELGLWCRRVAQITGEVHNASTEAEMQAAVDRIDALPSLPGDLSLQERVLGAIYQQMVADKVPDPYIQFCGQTAYIWIIADEATAERFWTSGGRPEAPGPVPNRADRRSAPKTSTAEVSGTPSPASTSGTSTRPRSGGSGRAKRSRGRRSSATGR